MLARLLRVMFTKIKMDMKTLIHSLCTPVQSAMG